MNQKGAITRLLSIDVFRGITIAVMILVNSPGNQFAHTWLEHSAWNGCTLADLVFPFFIVIVGMSSLLALTNWKIKNFSNNSCTSELRASPARINHTKIRVSPNYGALQVSNNDS